MKCKKCVYYGEVNNEISCKCFCELEFSRGKEKIELDEDQDCCEHYVDAEYAWNEILGDRN